MKLLEPSGLKTPTDSVLVSKVESPLPLPLLPFEAFLLADDDAHYPKSFFLRLDFSGSLRRNAFTAALAFARERNPLLSARIERLSGRPYFVPLSRCETWLDWDEEDKPWNIPPSGRCGLGIDPEQEGGPRVWVRCNENSSQALFQFHHAFCDGLGGFQFLEDLLCGYARECGESLTPRPLNSALLQSRGHFTLPPPASFREQLQITLTGLQLSYAFLKSNPTPLTSPSATHSVAVDFPGFLVHRLSVAETKTLQKAASRQEATVNDLALAALFQTFNEWNKRHRAEERQGIFRILMPTNLREPNAEQMPAANVMSFAFLERPWHSIRNIKTLLKGIRDETNAIKRYRLSLYFLGGLGMASGVPGLLPLFLRSRRSFATAVLTNLGDPSRRFWCRFPRQDGRCVVGNVVLENFAAVPPLRPRTRAGIGLVSYAGQLSVCLLCDPRYLRQAQTQALLEGFVEQLRALSRW